MSSESVCQVSRSWLDVGRFHTRLVVRFMIFTSVRNIVDSPSYSRGSRILNKSRNHLNSRRQNAVMQLVPYLRTHNSGVAWHFVLGACDGIQIFCVGKINVVIILQILSPAVQNLVARATRRSGFVQPRCMIYCHVFHCII
jgi:hypothetical protein